MFSVTDTLVMVRKIHVFIPPSNNTEPLGNLHLNIVADAYLPEIQAALEPYIYEVVGKWRRHLLD